MGKFQKGQPKPPGSGRKKGSTSSFKTIRKALEEHGFDITTELLSLFEDAYETKEKLEILKVLARYSQPTPKAETNPAPPPDPPEPGRSDPTPKPEAPDLRGLSSKELVERIRQKRFND